MRRIIKVIIIKQKILCFGFIYFLFIINSYGQIDSLFNTEKGTNEFTHLVFQNNEDSATLICNSYDFDFKDSAFYSHLTLYRLSLKSGSLRELHKIHKNLWDIWTTYNVQFEPDSNKIMYLILDTAERDNSKYKQQYYNLASTKDDWQSIENERLNLPFQKYFLRACLKTNNGCVFAGDTDNFMGSSFFAIIDNNNLCKVLKVYPFSFVIKSILKIQDNYLLSGAIFDKPNGTRFQMLVDSAGKEQWRKSYIDSMKFDRSGFGVQGVSKKNLFYNAGYKWIDSKVGANGILNCLDANGNLIFEREYEIGQNFGFGNLILRGDYIFGAALIDTVEDNGIYTNRILLLKIDPTDGHIVWFQNYHYGKQDIEIHNLYNTKNGFLLLGTGLNPKRLPEFDSTHLYETDGWLLMVDTNGCIVPGCKPNLIEGIQHILNDESVISVYPNPVEETINIHILNAKILGESCFIGIYDINGVELYKQDKQLLTEHFQIQRPANFQGFAILAIKNSAGTYYKKILFK